MSSSGFGCLWSFHYPGPAHQLLDLELGFGNEARVYPDSRLVVVADERRKPLLILLVPHDDWCHVKDALLMYYNYVLMPQHASLLT